MVAEQHAVEIGREALGSTAHERKLAVILGADAAGYSALMRRNEERALAQLQVRRRLFADALARHGGRIFGAQGDSVMAMFTSPMEALRGALEVQSEIAQLDTDLPDEDRMSFRIGLHLGDVMEASDGNFYGDGVNFAARIQSLALPGGIAVSSPFHAQVSHLVDLAFTDIGPRHLHNIDGRHSVWRLVPGGRRRPYAFRRRMLPALSAAGVLAVMIGVTILGNPLGLPLPWASRSTTSGQALAEDLAKPALIVVPIVNATSDPARDMMAYAATLDIHQRLSGEHGIRVISTDAADEIMSEAPQIRDVGRRYDLTYAVRGALRQESDKLFINLEMADAKSGEILWVSRLDGVTLTGFTLPADRLAEMVERLPVNQSAKSLGAANGRRGGTVKMVAFERWATGAGLMNENVEDSNVTARRYFEEAIAEDPKEPRYRTYLAYTYLKDWINNWGGDPKGSLARSHEIAQEITRTSPDSYYGYWAMGFSLMWLERFDESIDAYRRAVSINPNDSVLMGEMGDALVAAGRPEDAIAQVQMAIARNPGGAWWYQWSLAHAHLFARQLDEAIKIAEAIPSEYNDVKVDLAIAYAHRDGKGDRDHARQLIKEFYAVETKYALKEAARQPFKRPEDQAFWLEGLRAAGMPESL